MGTAQLQRDLVREGEASGLYSGKSPRSERQLVNQIQYNLLFRRFVGLPIATEWKHSLFSKKHDRRT